MYYRIQNAAAPDDPVFALVILAALTAPLHGNLIPPPILSAAELCSFPRNKIQIINKSFT